MARIAVAQMNSSNQLSQNLEQIQVLYEQAAEQGAKLIVLPENFAFMGAHEQDKLKLAEQAGSGEIQYTLKQLSKTYNLWSVAGTIPIYADEAHVFASSLVFNEQGIQVARYDKIHLFDVRVSDTERHQESATIRAGHEPVVVDTPVGCIGLSVCYDVRFPELYRLLQAKGAQLFTVPAAFTQTTGQLHWHTLLRARSIENMCYVLASNQAGLHASGRKTYGHSLIANPMGEVIVEIKDGAGIICADVDLEALHAKRASFPCLTHKVLRL